MFVFLEADLVLDFYLLYTHDKEQVARLGEQKI